MSCCKGPEFKVEIAKMMDPLVLILLFILFLLLAGLAVKSFRGNLKGDSILFIGLSQSGLLLGRMKNSYVRTYFYQSGTISFNQNMDYKLISLAEVVDMLQMRLHLSRNIYLSC